MHVRCLAQCPKLISAQKMLLILLWLRVNGEDERERGKKRGRGLWYHLRSCVWCWRGAGETATPCRMKCEIPAGSGVRCLPRKRLWLSLERILNGQCFSHGTRYDHPQRVEREKAKIALCWPRHSLIHHWRRSQQEKPRKYSCSWTRHSDRCVPWKWSWMSIHKNIPCLQCCQHLHVHYLFSRP